MSRSLSNFRSLKSAVKCMSKVTNAFINDALKNTCLRQRHRSVTYPVIGLAIILKMGINVKIIPIMNTGIPRCLAIVGKNGFNGAIPEKITAIYLYIYI